MQFTVLVAVLAVCTGVFASPTYERVFLFLRSIAKCTYNAVIALSTRLHGKLFRRAFRVTHRSTQRHDSLLVARTHQPFASSSRPKSSNARNRCQQQRFFTSFLPPHSDRRREIPRPFQFHNVRSGRRKRSRSGR